MNVTHEVDRRSTGRRSAKQVAPGRVLVADEDDDARERVLTAFIEDGYDVVGLRNGAELLECLDIIARDSLRAPDLIAMGAGTPRGSALQLLETLRSNGWTMPVVLLTWSGSSSVRTRVEMASPAALITKPFDVAQLRKATLDALSMAVPSGTAW